MTRAVIVSTARTPLAKSWKGAFNMTHGATLGGLAIQAAVERAGVDPAAIDDVLMGCANPEGATGWNIARQAALALSPNDLKLGVAEVLTQYMNYLGEGLSVVAARAVRPVWAPTVPRVLMVRPPVRVRRLVVTAVPAAQVATVAPAVRAAPVRPRVSTASVLLAVTVALALAIASEPSTKVRL